MTTAEYQREWRSRQDPASLRAKQNRYRATWQNRNPDKHAVHSLVHEAIKRGELRRPESCGQCGISCRPEASHDDYSRPLQVEWLCRACHARKDADKRRSLVDTTHKE